MAQIKGTVNGVHANTDGVTVAKAAYNAMSPMARFGIPEPSAGNAAAFGKKIMQYDNVWNEFARALPNVISRQWMDTAKVYDPLEQLVEVLDNPGYTDEEIYHDLYQATDYDAVSDSAADIFRQVTPHLYAIYHSINFQKKVKATYKLDILQRAFISWDAFGAWVADFTAVLYESMRLEKYKYAKNLFAMAAYGGYATPMEVTAIYKAAKKPTRDEIEDNITDIRSLIQRINFASRDYNYMGVYNSTWLDNCMFISTPEFVQAGNVKMLAKAFNVELAEVQSKIIVVDDFGGAEKIGCQGFIVDKRWFKIAIRLEKMTEQWDPAHLNWQYWYHCHGTFSFSMFQNCIMLVDKTKLDTITSVTITNSQKVKKDEATPIKVTIVAGAEGTKYHSNKLVWSISGNTSDKTEISPYGLLYVGPDETAGTISATAYSAQDPSKTSTVDVTVTS